MAKSSSPAQPLSNQPLVNESSSFFENSKIISIILFILAFVLYANTLTHGYVLDDYMVIKNNSFTQDGFGGLWKILTTDSFYGYFDDRGEQSKALLVTGGRYRPLSLMLL